MMVRKGLATLAIASTMLVSSAAVVSAKSAVAAPKKTVDIACMATAVDARDTAVISAVDMYSSAVKAALSVQKDALKAAWTNSNAKTRNVSLRTARKAFQTSWKKASADLRAGKNGSWKTFESDRKKCAGPAEDSSTDARL